MKFSTASGKATFSVFSSLERLMPWDPSPEPIFKAYSIKTHHLEQAQTIL